jgi:hypothetical protein
MALNNPQRPDFLLSLADDTDIVPWINITYFNTRTNTFIGEIISPRDGLV